MILHALDATVDGATDLSIYSPGTDVSVLAIRRYPEMCANTSFVTGKGANHRTIKLQPIVDALSTLPKQPIFQHFTQSQALITLEVFQGSKGKVACWKVFLDADESITDILGKLGKAEQPDDNIKREVERFFCQLYLQKTDIATVKEFRWFLFRKKQAQSDRLPCTRAALVQAILHAQFNLMVWNKNNIPNSVIPSPSSYD